MSPFGQRAQLVEGNCPDCGRPVKKMSRSAYFFKLSKYSDKLVELLGNGTFLQPESRAKEMISFDRGSRTYVSQASLNWASGFD